VTLLLALAVACYALWREPQRPTAA
jgi:hypothetical protein